MNKILKSIQFDPHSQVEISSRVKFESDEVLTPDVLTDNAQPVGPSPQETADEIINKARKQADMLLQVAKSEAKQIIEQAGVKAKTQNTKGYNEGWAKGKKEAQAAFDAEISQQLFVAKNWVKGAIEAHNHFLEESRREISQLAIAIARKIMGQAVADNPDAVKETVAQVLIAARITGGCRIRVNPEDYEILNPHWNAIAGLQNPNEPWELVSDRNVTSGGCIIDVGGGTIDAQIETQLERVSQAFEEMG